MTHSNRDCRSSVPVRPAPLADDTPIFSHAGWVDVRRRLRLHEALSLRYPALERSLGPDEFAIVAHAVAHVAPPRSPVLIDWGGEMATVLECLALSRNLAFLPDLARLEWLRWRALNAADARAMPIHELAVWATSSARPMFLRLHPSASVMTSVHPIVTILECLLFPRADPLGLEAPQSALVARQGDRIITHEIAEIEAVFLGKLIEGAALDVARRATEAVDPSFSSAPSLNLLIQLGLVTGAC